jgi:MerR family transcriptional regulator, light-induced transcriptional regulator
MGRQAGALQLTTLNRQSLNRLETHFVAPAIYRRHDATARQAKLAQIVSSQIIPRLLHLHEVVLPQAPTVGALVEALAPESKDISGLADIVIGADLEAAAAYVIVLRDRGLSMETLFIELLEPTARFLGEMWERDECDFIDVTLGVARLQKLLAVFNDTHSLPALNARRHVLMATTPGNQHTFGVSMVEKFLLAAGWRVRTELSGTSQDIVDHVQQDWFAVAGLTAGSNGQIPDLISTIADVRRFSKNPNIGIMVGGPMFIENPQLSVEVCADATAVNAPTAVLVAQKLFDAGELSRSAPFLER